MTRTWSPNSIKPYARAEYKDELFKDATGKSLDDLWAEFLESQKK